MQLQRVVKCYLNLPPAAAAAENSTLCQYQQMRLAIFETWENASSVIKKRQSLTNCRLTPEVSITGRSIR
jgi:hypothetical protein